MTSENSAWCTYKTMEHVKTPRITVIDGIVKVPNERLYHKVTRRNRYIVFQRKINSNRSNVISYLFRVSIMSLLRKPTNDPKLFAKKSNFEEKNRYFWKCEIHARYLIVFILRHRYRTSNTVLGTRKQCIRKIILNKVHVYHLSIIKIENFVSKKLGLYLKKKQNSKIVL